MNQESRNNTLALLIMADILSKFREIPQDCENLRMTSEMGKPTQNMWIRMPTNTTEGALEGLKVMAESGNITNRMK